MLSVLLSKSASYRICPNKIPHRDDLYFEKTIKGEHWSYFTISLNQTQFFMYMNITTTGNTSIYIGRKDQCPYRNDEPFIRVGPVTGKYVRAWKKSMSSFPIGIYAEEESTVKISIDPVDFKFDVELYAKWGVFILVTVFIVVQFIRGHNPFSNINSKKKRRYNRKNR